MSKQDRAAKAIKFGAARGYTPEQIATLLNELNLLTPELPEPDNVDEFCAKFGIVEAFAGNVIINTPRGQIKGSTETAISLAKSLLAAVQYTKEQA